MIDHAALTNVPPLKGCGDYLAPFAGMPRSEENFGGKTGVVIGASFTQGELIEIRNIIQRFLAERARSYSANAARLIEDHPLSQYHEICESIDHGRLLSKEGRILPSKAVDQIRQMSFFDYVQKTFGDFSLSDEEGVGYGQICFRVVRPNHREDVGALHCDSWFWDHYGFEIPEGKQRVKVWVPVYGEPQSAGLLLSPGSHLNPIPWHADKSSGKLVFVPDVPDDLPLQRFCGDPGDTVFFNYKCLHAGALNQGADTRVSFEITILFDKEDKR